jgi:hypothetical protein
MALEFGLGRFDDRRLEKGGPSCMRLWLKSRAAVSVGWADGGRGKCSSRVFCAILR